MVNSTGEGIVGIDRFGTIMLVNPVAASMTGYAAEELVGRSLHEFVHHSAVDHGSCYRRACPITRTLSDGIAVRGDQEVFSRKDGSTFQVQYVITPVQDDNVITGALVMFRDVTYTHNFQSAVSHRAWHDELTRLPNRARLRSELEALAGDESGCQRFALLLLDLDFFKEVNETLGHRAGDVVLQQIGPRLARDLSPVGLIARLSGDEFAVVVPGACAETAQAISEQILSAFERPFVLDGADLALSCSIGVVLYPEHALKGENPADTLLRRAEVAMYAAKRSRSGSMMYQPEDDAHSPARLALVADLRCALQRGELRLHYQPQVDLRTGRLAGVEALVRWQHPVRGLLPPEDFIPLAEDSRLIQRLGGWVLDAAVRQSVAWAEMGFDLPVAVNVSAHELQDGGFPDRVAACLAMHGVPPQRLRIEITETSLMAHPERAREILAHLRAQGVEIAIDDFGSGYSSLAYLKDLPVDELKIDKSFVQHMTDDQGARAIVRAIIDLADDLGLRVVAEGLEDRSTSEILSSLACRFGQGYYFAPPLEAAELARWAERMVDWRLDESQRIELEAALAERDGTRGLRLAVEEEFIARKRAEWAVREGQVRLGLALDTAGMAIWDWDLARDTIAWAGATAGLYGRDLVSDRGVDAFLIRVHADDRQSVGAALAEAIDQGRDMRIEYRVVRADGTIRWLACGARVLRDPSGQVGRVLGTQIDITERREAEQQRHALAQTEKLRALGQMASGVAHDLNQSLGLIAGYGHLAQRAVADTAVDVETLREALPIIAQAALDGGEIVRRLLTFARSRPEGQAERMHVNTVLRDVAQLTAPRWRDASQASGCPITLDLETTGDAVIVGWPVALREALTNLVLNAVDALPSGGALRLSAEPLPDGVVIAVADSGVGMSAEVQARIFEPFFTTKGERGTGLGLAQVLGVVQQHRGRIGVESRPGEGTTFHLTFPTVSDDTSIEPGPSTPQASPVLLRVLAVDDEPAMGSLIRRVLRPHGHYVVTATSGEMAVEHLTREPFDVVISDVGMGPGMNGWEFVERVRTLRPRTRVVLATGWGAAIEPADARAKGVDAVLAKPYRPDELESVLSRL